MTPYRERLLQADRETLSPRVQEIQDYVSHTARYDGKLQEIIGKKSQSQPVTAQDEQECLQLRKEINTHFKQVQPLIGDLSYRFEFIPDPHQTPDYNRALEQVYNQAFRWGNGDHKGLREIIRDVSELEELAKTAGAEAEWQQFAPKHAELTNTYEDKLNDRESGQKKQPVDWVGKTQRAMGLSALSAVVGGAAAYFGASKLTGVLNVQNKKLDAGIHGAMTSVGSVLPVFLLSRKLGKDPQAELPKSFEIAHYDSVIVNELENMADIIASKLSGQKVTPEALERLNAPIEPPNARAANESHQREVMERQLGAGTERLLNAR